MFISWASEVINKRAHLFKIPLVDNFTIFEDKLKESKLNREDLFVKDGHCNALGYGVIAENVYKSLVQNRVIDGIINR
jgi:lysophospholipase L1-like esterase